MPTSSSGAEPPCVDLDALVGHKWRVRFEGGGGAPRGEPKEEYVWFRQIVCRYGLIYPFGGKILKACTSHKKIGNKLRELPFVMKCWGDVEVVAHFHVNDLDEILKIMRPFRSRKKNQL